MATGTSNDDMQTPSTTGVQPDLKRILLRQTTLLKKLQNELEMETKLSVEGAENADEYYRRLRKLKDNIADVESTIEECKLDMTVSTSSVCADTSSTSSQLKLLEKMLTRQTVSGKLPKFDGDPLKYSHFSACFDRTTAILNLSDEENLVRLQDALDGQARRCVRYMLDDPGRVGEILETLKRRFGDNTIRLKHAMDRLDKIAMPDIEKPQSVVDFAEAVGDVDATVRADGSESTSAHLMLQVERKLSSTLMTQWRMYQLTFQCLPTLEKMLEWLNILADQAWRTMSINPTDSFKTRKSDAVKSTPSGRVHAAEARGASKANACYACGKPGHFVSKCDAFKVMPVEKRVDIVKRHRLCEMCLYSGHGTENCRSSAACDVLNCGLRHNSLLHVRETAATNIVMASKMFGRLPVLPVHVSGPNGTMRVCALIDTGSNVTFIDSDVAAIIGASGPLANMNVDGYFRKSNKLKARVVTVDVSSVHGSKQCKLKGVLSSDIPLSSYQQNAEALKASYPYLKDVPIESFAERPRMLIGTAHSYATEAQEVVARHPGEPRCYRSPVGWYVMGPAIQTTETCATNHMRAKEMQMLDAIAKQMVSLDDFAVRERPKLLAKDDEKAIAIMKSTVRRTSETTVEIGLLWRSTDVVLPDNYDGALARLVSEEKKMARKPSYHAGMRANIDSYLAKGYLEKAGETYGENRTDRDWYIPYFGVVNANKPGKIRFVCDCKADAHGTSLNKNLLSGPDLNNTIVGTLMRFRRYPVAIVADVQEMFHQVSVRPEDRRAQRILWRNGDSSREPDIYHFNVMMFGTTCSPTCAQFVKNWNAEEYAAEYPSAAKAIMRQFYVDDYLDSTPNEVTAMQLIRDVTYVQSRANFKMTKWASNSNQVLEAVPEDMRSTCSKVLPGSAERLLGLVWNPKTDMLQVGVSMDKVGARDPERKCGPTKRRALSIVMCLYDPLGLASYVTIKGRIFLQKLWRESVEWDETIPAALLPEWEQFMQSLHNVRNVEVPRAYSSTNLNKCTIELHTFCDASQEAFAAAVYARLLHDGGVTVRLIYAKSRVAPMKTMTVPRLELQAAVLGVRIAEYVKAELDLPVADMRFWTDSTIVLSWISSDARQYNIFVSNRVSEILEHTTPMQWRWVATDYNPADYATRSVPAYDNLKIWFDGPEYLYESDTNWPTCNIACNTTEEARVHVGSLMAEPPFIDVSRFSRLPVLLRVAACVLRPVGESHPFTVEELDNALLHLVRESQRESFRDERQRVMHGGAAKGRLKAVETHLDDGYLRVTTRLRHADYLSDETKRPYVLDGKHALTLLLIRYMHAARGHQGVETVKAELRRRFYVVGIRVAIKRVVRACQLCALKKRMPVAPRMGDLPDVRTLKNVHPFEYCGLDYFGPFFTKCGRNRLKRWGALFTCLTIRAVHLEIVPSLTTDSALMAIQRMSNRRGAPKTIFCDMSCSCCGRKPLKSLSSAA